MQTSMRISHENRDRLARIANDELGGVSMDEAVRILIFEHQARIALARLATDPEAAESYLRESRALAGADVEVRE